MTNSVRVGRPAIRFALGVALCAGVAFGISLTVSAGQLRSITDGVYSSQQAERGRAVYQAQCESCHGDALQGAGVGPPLIGDVFMSNWSARPLSDVVDKIQKTMPFYMPGSLSRQQSTDLTAYILQTGKFPAGKADLSEGPLMQIALPTVRAATASVALSGTSLPPPQGTLAEFMRASASIMRTSYSTFSSKIPRPSRKSRCPYRLTMFNGDTPCIRDGWLSIRPPLLSPKQCLCF